MRLQYETVGYVSLDLRVPVGNVQSVVLQSRNSGDAKWKCYATCVRGLGECLCCLVLPLRFTVACVQSMGPHTQWYADAKWEYYTTRF